VLIIKCSQALYEYMRIVQKVAGRVMELMAEGLGMQDTGVFRGMVHRDGSDELLRVNHYPPSLRPEAAGGGSTATTLLSGASSELPTETAT
jgi:gibberellin 2-oxidase